MKSILVIGIGRFGKHLCIDLVKNGNDVMAVDEREENLEDILSLVTSAKIADCTREEVLRSFGGRKIVVTPGLVELGVLEKSENYMLGARLVGLDFVILVGERLVESVKDGYVENGGDPEKIKTVLGLPAAQEELKNIIKEGDTVLFLNDLPDYY